jgi:hypothetical protein
MGGQSETESTGGYGPDSIQTGFHDIDEEGQQTMRRRAAMEDPARKEALRILTEKPGRKGNILAPKVNAPGDTLVKPVNPVNPLVSVR